jgi:hypothetical protein
MEVSINFKMPPYKIPDYLLEKANRVRLQNVFDTASKAWAKNKRKSLSGTYIYPCSVQGCHEPRMLYPPHLPIANYLIDSVFCKAHHAPFNVQKLYRQLPKKQ